MQRDDNQIYLVLEISYADMYFCVVYLVLWQFLVFRGSGKVVKDLFSNDSSSHVNQ